MRIKAILQNYNTTHTKYQELLSAMLKEQRGERMDEEFILPQPGALGLCLVAAVQQQEDVAHGHHHG